MEVFSHSGREFSYLLRSRPGVGGVVSTLYLGPVSARPVGYSRAHSCLLLLVLLYEEVSVQL